MFCSVSALRLVQSILYEVRCFSTDRKVSTEIQSRGDRYEVEVRIEIRVMSVAENRTKNVARLLGPTATGRRDLGSTLEGKLEKSDNDQKSEMQQHLMLLEMCKSDLLDFGRVEVRAGMRPGAGD